MFFSPGLRKSYSFGFLSAGKETLSSLGNEYKMIIALYSVPGGNEVSASKLKLSYFNPG